MKDFVRWDTNSFKWHTSSTPHFTKSAIPSHVHNRRHVSLLWDTSIQSTASRSVFKAILILSFPIRLGLLSGLFPLYFPHQNPICISCVPHTLPIWTSLIFLRNNVWWQVHITKILSSKSSPAFCDSTVPTSQYVSLSDTSTLRPGLHLTDQVSHPHKATKHLLFCTFWSVCTYMANAKTKLHFYHNYPSLCC
jgi:hypothetical protein